MTFLTYSPEHSSESTPGLTPDVECIDLAGRKAWHCTSRHGAITLPAHPLGKSKGHITLWICPTEELSQHPMLWRTWASNGIGHTVPILSDHPESPNPDGANLSMFWQPHWGHPFFVKFAPGSYFPGVHDPEKRFFIEGWIEELRRHTWYRLDLAFDHDQAYHALWINGILAGRSNQHGRTPATYEPCGPQLFLRSPQIAFGTVTFHDQPLTASEIAAAYAAEAPPENHEPDMELQRALTGKGNPVRDLSAHTADWETTCDLSLTDPSQAEHFYLQGCPDALHWQKDGLRILTPQQDPYIGTRERKEHDDPCQMYLWSKQMFHGDLYLAFDFMPLEHGGLVLLIPRASGMQGEDFMQDYPLRTSGAMDTIHSSDIRMYHWEFFREMDDTRNDVPSHAIIKWPWEITLAGGIGSTPFRFREWNRIEYLQQDNHFQGAVNGEVVIEGDDHPYQGKGPVLRHGHLAIRGMIRTDIQLRNLVVKTNQ
jgi:hypothetical protein